MQTLTAGQYGALDSLSRNPCARVQVKRNYDSIPFEGKTIQSTLTNEKYPKHILHSDGRLCMVYSKYNTTYSKYDLYFKATNIARTVWNSSVEVAQSASHDYNYPAIVQINSSNNLGIIVSRDGTDLFSCVVNTSGVIQTALADTAINGTNPSLTLVGSTYWLVYEASGILYYRTSADFVTWSAATNLNTITGLSDEHYSPYIYYDTSNKLWLTFERVSDTTANPVVKNVYTMLSNDNGSSWDSPVAQTVLTAGEGSCINSSIVDTTAYRYINYTLERQIQNYDFSSKAYDMFEQEYDSVNNRVLMATTNGIVIYDLDTAIITVYDNTDYADIVNARHISYDSTNKIIVIGTNANGIVTYNEDTTVWNTYSTATTPAISKNSVLAVKIEDNKIYACLSDNSYYIYNNIIDIVADTVEVLSSTPEKIGTANYSAQIFLESTRVLFHMKLGGAYPHTSVYSYYNKTDFTHYFTDYAVGSATYTPYQSQVSQRNTHVAYHTEDKLLYIPSEDTTGTNDYGIAVYQVSDSGITFSKYWSNVGGNTNGLLPNSLQSGSEYTYGLDIVCNSGNNRLYYWCGDLGYGATREYFLCVINLTTETVIEKYARTNSDTFLTLFPAIDNDLVKIISGYSTRDVWNIIVDDNKNLYFHMRNLSYIGIVFTESLNQRVYYRKTADDSTWTTQAYLTSDSKDNNCNLGYSDGRLKSFWNRDVDGIYELRWDEDLSTAIDVSEYVESITIDKTDEHSSNKATILLSDSIGMFDPLNYSSLLHDYFAENNIITIEKGNNGNYNDAFYGFIGSGESTYKRGEQIVYRLDIWDKSKNFFQKKVTTPLFEGQTVSYIADYIALNYMGLAAGQYDTLPSITNIIPTVQFIDECVMDILFKIYQPYNYFPWFDESGNLKAKEYNYDASVDFTYYQDGTDTAAANKAPAMNIIGFDYEWTDKDLVNQVTVIGETEATTETTFPEEFMGTLQGSAGWYSKSTDFDFWFSTDKSMYCEEPRLSVEDSCGNKFFGGGEDLSTAGSGKQQYCVVSQKVSQLITALYVLIGAALAQWMLYGMGIGSVAVVNPLAAVLAMALTILGQVGSYYYNIYARPVGDALPDTIEAVANDTDLQGKYGIVPMEIDNPFLNTYEKCLTLAENELEKSKWFRYIPTLRICSNMAHQIGDVINAYNQHTGNSYKIFVTDISNEYKRGEADVDVVRGGLIL